MRVREVERRSTPTRIPVAPSAWRLMTAALALALVPAVARADNDTPKPIHLHIFLSKTCSHCELVEAASLQRLAREHRLDLVPHYYDIDNMDEYKRLIVLERRLGDTGNKLPVVVVGQRILGGTEEIEERLLSLLVRLRGIG